MNAPASKRRHRTATPRPEDREREVSGAALDLPLVRRVGTIRAHSASRITWHFHEQFESLFLLEGSTAYEFEDGRTVELPGGHFLVIPPRVRHRGLHDVRTPAQLCGVMFDPGARQAIRQTPFLRADLHWLRRQFQRRAMEPQRIGPELRRSIRSLNTQLATPGLRSTAATAALRLTLCAILLESARQLASPSVSEPSQAVRAAIDCMHRRYAEPLSMDALAHAASCSRARLFRTFKEATGMTPNDYLQRLRIGHAQSALANSHEPITTISLRCGFSSSQYFSNVFRKYTGATPSGFRAQQRESIASTSSGFPSSDLRRLAAGRVQPAKTGRR